MFCTPWFVLPVPPANAHTMMLSVMQGQDSVSWVSVHCGQGDRSMGLAKMNIWSICVPTILKNDLNWGKPSWSIKKWTQHCEGWSIESQIWGRCCFTSTWTSLHPGNSWDTQHPFDIQIAVCQLLTFCDWSAGWVCRPFNPLEALADALCINQTVRELHLQRNQIGDEGFKAWWVTLGDGKSVGINACRKRLSTHETWISVHFDHFLQGLGWCRVHQPDHCRTLPGRQPEWWPGRQGTVVGHRSCLFSRGVQRVQKIAKML